MTQGSLLILAALLFAVAVCSLAASAARTPRPAADGPATGPDSAGTMLREGRGWFRRRRTTAAGRTRSPRRGRRSDGGEPWWSGSSDSGSSGSGSSGSGSDGGSGHGGSHSSCGSSSSSSSSCGGGGGCGGGS